MNVKFTTLLRINSDKHGKKVTPKGFEHRRLITMNVGIPTFRLMSESSGPPPHLINLKKFIDFVTPKGFEPPTFRTGI